MPLSPELKPLIEEAAKMPPFTTVTIQEARRIIAGMGEGGDWSLPPPEPAEVFDRTVPGPAGPIPVRIYKPGTPGPHPLMAYFHGGGFALGGLDTDDAMCRHYCVEADCVVVSVDYRLAPENPFPAAPDDCYAVTVWAMGEGAKELGIDPDRTVTAGMSAGGNLATVIPAMLRDRGARQVKAQLLQVPVTDVAGEPETASYAEFATGYMLPAVEMYWFWDMYGPGPLRYHAYAAPLRSGTLEGLPPALVLTAECDVLRDEGEAYAKKLAAAGVEVEHHRINGINHLMGAFTAKSEISRRVIALQMDWLRKVFGTA